MDRALTLLLFVLMIPGRASDAPPPSSPDIAADGKIDYFSTERIASFADHLFITDGARIRI